MSLLADAPPVSGLILHRPTGSLSLDVAAEAAELFAAYRGYDLDLEQRRTLDVAMATLEDGKTWAASEVGDFKARQVGKGDTIEARELWGLILGGERLQLHTAHEFPTANEAFLRMASLFENYDDLRRKVARVRYANGEQGIEMKTGQRLKYKARTGGGGRGFAGADLVVLDEGQHLRPEHIAAVGPTITANPNAQIWTAGSGGLEFSQVAWRLRKRALSSDGGRLAYTERTAEVVGDDGRLYPPEITDPLDHELLMRAHPGYAAGRVSRESLDTLYRSMGFDLFLRECLCIWMPEPGEQVAGPIPLEVWDSLTDATSMPDAKRSRIALDTNPERSWFTACLAGERDDGLVHGEITKSYPDKSRAVEFAAEASKKLDSAVVVTDRALADDLERAGAKVDVMKPGEFAAATSALIDATRGEAPKLRHRGEPALRRALEAAQTKPYGDGGIVWSRRTTAGDISPLTALTAAFGRLVATDAREFAGGFASLDDWLTDDD